MKKDYEQILSSNDLLFDPFTSDKWEDDVTKFPAIDIGKIFSYILASKAFSTEYIGQYKIRKAFSYFMSGFVDKIQYNHNHTIIIEFSVLNLVSVPIFSLFYLCVTLE